MDFPVGVAEAAAGYDLWQPRWKRSLTQLSRGTQLSTFIHVNCSMAEPESVFFAILNQKTCGVLRQKQWFLLLRTVATPQCFLGMLGAGKSSLVLRFVKGQFVEFQGYCEFLGQEKLLQSVEVGQEFESLEGEVGS